jgi:hypothetical protein
VAPAKSHRLTGPRCSGELQGGWPRKVVCGSGGSEVDERGKGKTGTGRWPTFILKKNLLGGTGRERGKGGGRRGRVHVEEEKKEMGAYCGSRQRGAAGNAPNQRAWAAPLPREQSWATSVDDEATRVNRADERDRGDTGPGVSGGVPEGERKVGQRGGGALTCGPGQHSAGRRGLNLV